MNERLCDCNGDLVSLDEIIVKEDTLVIGQQSEEFHFYHFHRGNSNLIQLMEVRSQVSSSLYISIISVIIVLSIYHRAKDRKGKFH